MKLLRLPSGRGVNVDDIFEFGKLLKGPNVYGGTDVLYVNGEFSLFFEDADARALYAWLEAHSAAIGEDGREVAKVPSDGFPPGYAEFLKALKVIWPFGLSDVVAYDDYELSIDDLGSMIDDGFILSTSKGYIIRELGISMIEDD